MYTAKLAAKSLEQGQFRWVVEFTDGAPTPYIWRENFTVPKYEVLQDRVTQRLSELNVVDSYTIDAPILPRTVIQNQPEIDRNEWLRDWAILEKADKLIAAGVFPASLTQYVNHKNKVITNFKPAYIPYL